MLVVAWRQSASPRAAVAALSFVSLLAVAEAPAAPSPGDASALTVVRWEPQRAPRAALDNLYRNGALEPSSTAVAAPEPESVSSPPAIQWQAGKAPRAALRNLYGNQALEPSSVAVVAPIPGDASALMVVRWEPQRAPRAATAALYRSTALEPSSTAVGPPEPDTASWRPPIRWPTWRAPRASLACLYRWQVPADELEPYPDATAITVVAWKGSGAPRWALAATRALYANPALEPSSTAVAPAEPESVTAPPAVRWKPGHTPRAVLRALYGNVALEPSSTVVVTPEPESITAPPAIRWRPGRAARAAVRTLYGNVALEPSSTAEPDSVTTRPAIRWRVARAPFAALAALYRNIPGEAPVILPDTGPRGAIPPVISRWKPWRAPRAALAALYRYARFDFETGPEPLIVLDRLRIEFIAPNGNRTFIAQTAPTFTAARQAKVFVAQGRLEVVRGPTTDEFTAGERGG